MTRDKEYTQWPLTKFVQLHISYNCCFVSVFLGGAEIAFVHRVRCNKLTVVGCLVNVFSFSRNLLGFTVCHRKYYLCFFFLRTGNEYLGALVFGNLKLMKYILKIPRTLLECGLNSTFSSLQHLCHFII